MEEPHMALVTSGRTIRQQARQPAADPWETAKLRFIADLSPADRKAFLTAKPGALETLFYDASNTHRRFEDSRLRICQRALSPLFSALEDFGKALDVFANVSQVFLCPIWGGIRVVLTMANRSTKYFDDVLEMFARIGDCLPRLLKYQSLFKDDKELLGRLSTAYLDVLIFCIDIKNKFSTVRGSLPRTLKQVWNSFGPQFEKNIQSFKDHAEAVREQANLSHLTRAAEHRALERRRHDEDIKTRLLDRLCKHSPFAKHREAQRTKHPGTGDWLISCDTAQAWLAHKRSSLLALFGSPGSGKTILTASMIDSLRKYVRSNNMSAAIAYHYCDYANKTTLEADTLWSSICRQLLEDINIPSDVAVGINDNVLPESLLLPILTEHKTIFIVVDGIDELQTNLQIQILRTLRRAMDGHASLKCFISSRREEVRMRKSLADALSIDLSLCTSEMSDDLTLFITDQVEELIDSGQLHASIPQLKTRIIRALHTKAEDMFLWVALQLRELCAAEREEDVSEMLDSIPPDLQTTYRRMFQKIITSPGGSWKVKRAKKVFAWLKHARRLITLSELTVAVSVAPSDLRMAFERVPEMEDYTLLDCCGNFVSLDRTFGTVQFFHHTAQMFIDEMEMSVAGSSLESPEKIIAEICLAYLRFADFDQTVSKTQPVVLDDSMTGIALADTATRYGASRPLTSVARSILSMKINHAAARSPVSFHTSGSPGSQQSRDWAGYELLEYVRVFWLEHVESLSTSPLWESSFISAQLYHSICQLHRPFVFRTWMPSDNFDEKQSIEAFFCWLLLSKKDGLLTAMMRYSPKETVEALRHIFLRPLNTNAQVFETHKKLLANCLEASSRRQVFGSSVANVLNQGDFSIVCRILLTAQIHAFSEVSMEANGSDYERFLVWVPIVLVLSAESGLKATRDLHEKLSPGQARNNIMPIAKAVKLASSFRKLNALHWLLHLMHDATHLTFGKTKSAHESGLELMKWPAPEEMLDEKDVYQLVEICTGSCGNNLAAEVACSWLNDKERRSEKRFRNFVYNICGAAGMDLASAAKNETKVKSKLPCWLVDLAVDLVEKGEERSVRVLAEIFNMDPAAESFYQGQTENVYKTWKRLMRTKPLMPTILRIILGRIALPPFPKDLEMLDDDTRPWSYLTTALHTTGSDRDYSSETDLGLIRMMVGRERKMQQKQSEMSFEGDPAYLELLSEEIYVTALQRVLNRHVQQWGLDSLLRARHLTKGAHFSPFDIAKMEGNDVALSVLTTVCTESAEAEGRRLDLADCFTR